MAEKQYIIDGQRVTKDEYNRLKFDRFLITVPKGKKAEFQAHAESLGMSLNAFIVQAIAEKMEKAGE